MKFSRLKSTSNRPARSTSRSLAVTAVLLAAVLTPLPATASIDTASSDTASPDTASPDTGSTGAASTGPGPEVAALARSLGDRTAGFYRDAAARTTVVTVTDPADAAAVRSAGATPRLVERGGADLARVTEALDREARIPGTAWAVDVPANQVVVSFDDTVSGAELVGLRAVAARFPGAVRLEAAPGTTRPFIGGGDTVYGDTLYIRCVIAFNVRNSAGTYHFLTAGHCTNASTFWYADQGRTIPLGSTAGSSFPGNDYGIVRYTNTSIPKEGGIRLYNGSYVDITSAGNPYVGQYVNSVTTTTGLMGGTVTALNATVNYAQGTVYGLIKTSICAESGRSGAPLFRSSVAYGILSGGSGTCSTGGTTYFQPVTEALAAYQVSVY